MHWNGNTIVVTGGASGIGLGLATRLVETNTVILVGRDKEKLAAAVRSNPKFHTFACDVGQANERLRLFERITADFPLCNVLINNAGIQRRSDVRTEEDWSDSASELAINFEAPFHLSKLFIPHFQSKSEAAIVNVSSGLAFVPMAVMPMYCATKAALHSFTLSLRHSLKDSPIEVFEIIPPAVNTDLGGKGLHDFGEPLDEFCDCTIKGLLSGKKEFAYGMAIKLSRASRVELDAAFEGMNNR